MQMQEYQLDFVTYCVGNLADRLNMSASKVCKRLRVYTLPFIVKVLTFAP